MGVNKLTISLPWLWFDRQPICRLRFAHGNEAAGIKQAAHRWRQILHWANGFISGLFAWRDKLHGFSLVARFAVL